MTPQNSEAPAATQIITKDEWIRRAIEKLDPYRFKNAPSHAESLYQTYVVEDACGYENDPEGAVEEDMSYWGD